MYRSVSLWSQPLCNRLWKCIQAAASIVLETACVGLRLFCQFPLCQNVGQWALFESRLRGWERPINATPAIRSCVHAATTTSFYQKKQGHMFDQTIHTCLIGFYFFCLHVLEHPVLSVRPARVGQCVDFVPQALLWTPQILMFKVPKIKTCKMRFRLFLQRLQRTRQSCASSVWIWTKFGWRFPAEFLYQTWLSLMVFSAKKINTIHQTNKFKFIFVHFHTMPPKVFMQTTQNDAIVPEPYRK